MYDKVVQVAILFDFYGQLLTEKQFEIVDLYYNNDLSLGEISEQLGISRQGVFDSLKRAEKTLFEYEEKLKLMERFLRQKEEIGKIVETLDSILKSGSKDTDITRKRLSELRDYVRALTEQ